MTDDFSNHPKSISEIRSDRSDDAMDCAPRDILIAALREIDSGEWKPTLLGIVGIARDERGTYTDFEHFFAGGQYLDLIALFERAKLNRL